MFEVCEKYMVPSRQFSSLKLPSPKRGENVRTGGKRVRAGGGVSVKFVRPKCLNPPSTK